MSREKKAGTKGKEIDSPKEAKGQDKSEQKVESASSGQGANASKQQKDVHEQKGNPAEEVGDNEKSEKKDEVKRGEEGKSVNKKELGGCVGVKAADGAKTGKKKIIRKIVKQKKVADNKDGSEDPTDQSGKLDEKRVVEKIPDSETAVQQDESSVSAAPVKTFVRKKVVKKIPVAKATRKENEGAQTEVKADDRPQFPEDTPKDNPDSSSTPMVQDAAPKTTVKKKIIKRVPKRKLTGAETNTGAANKKKADDMDEKKVSEVGSDSNVLGDHSTDAKNSVDEAKSENKITAKTSKSVTPEKPDDLVNSAKTGSKAEKVDIVNSAKTGSKTEKVDKNEEEADEKKNGSGEKVGNEADKRAKSKERQQSKDEEKKKKAKEESGSKANKGVKEKKQPEDPPRHPGLFLQTSGSKDSKLRSLSFSLDSLLDYTDKDVEESTFELSLFAESLYEMLQHQMGYRILAFLQKLRIKFVMKRNQRKRLREESSKGGEEDPKGCEETSKGGDQKPSTKRVKTDEAATEPKPTKTGTHVGADPVGDQIPSAKRGKTDEATMEPKPTKIGTHVGADPGDGKPIVKEADNSIGGTANVKQEDDTSVGGTANMNQEDDSSIGGTANVKQEEDGMDDEDPEEDPEEDEEMLNSSPQHYNVNEENSVEEKADADRKSEKVNEDVKFTELKSAEETLESKPMSGSEDKENGDKVETHKKEKAVTVDKELLQAFRFFDRNRVGYIRVEDMRLIIHNLGKFFSHRDVKELVQSALLESNTGRDDHILYNKLVRMTDL